jgi:hypothetical protein
MKKTYLGKCFFLTKLYYRTSKHCYNIQHIGTHHNYTWSGNNNCNTQHKRYLMLILLLVILIVVMLSVAIPNVLALYACHRNIILFEKKHHQDRFSLFYPWRKLISAEASFLTKGYYGTRIKCPDIQYNDAQHNNNQQRTQRSGQFSKLWLNWCPQLSQVSSLRVGSTLAR